eukprot:15469628-Alexandrium_andersonii.AAC.1
MGAGLHNFQFATPPPETCSGPEGGGGGGAQGHVVSRVHPRPRTRPAPPQRAAPRPSRPVASFDLLPA